MPQHEPDHRPPTTPPPAPPRREALNELKPPAAFRIAARRTQLRRPRPSPVGDIDPDSTVPGNNRDRDRLPGSTRAGVPDRITEDLAGQQDGHIPARVPRAEYLRDECTGGTRSARPASVTLSRTATLAITAPALPRPPRPGKPAGQRADAGTCTLSSAANVKPAQRAPREPRPWLVRGRTPRPWPSVKRPTVRADRPGGTPARPLCVRGHRNTTPYSATR